MFFTRLSAANRVLIFLPFLLSCIHSFILCPIHTNDCHSVGTAAAAPQPATSDSVVRKSASISVQLKIAKRSFSRINFSFVYFGRLIEKKQV
mmetsp:Transcript_23619/g.39498  ORF Transcript_23619/g.39498 Transcript_23619/m.39498 type:complete len:92 (+) Transcript_23619:261-536(+)